MPKKFTFNHLIFFSYLILSITLAFIWLPHGKYSGGGDVGIPTYEPGRILEIESRLWWETQATGTYNPLSYTALPFHFILNVLDSVGFGPDITQKLFIITILAGGSFSIFLISRRFKLANGYAFLAGLTYIFNFMSLSVWHRGVHNAMLLLLLAPLTLFLLIKGTDERKYTSILWINLASFFMSYIFGTPAFVAAIWILWLVYLLILLKDNFHDSKYRKFIFIYSATLFLSWTILNLWWIMTFVEASKYVLGQFNMEDIKERSSDVLLGLKVYTEGEYILRGINAFNHYGVFDWGKFYLFPGVLFASWIPALIVFSTTLYKKNHKLGYWRFLIIFTVICLIISKGANSPLGWANKLAYDNLGSLLAPLRNPYEKVGILLVIPYSILFALGCSQILEVTKKIPRAYLKLSVYIICFISLIVLVWPLWAGQIFRSSNGNFIFTVPEYYKQANDWFKKNNDDTRILHLPMATGESTDYNWGYTGIEPSQLFFPGSSIGYQTGVKE